MSRSGAVELQTLARRLEVYRDVVRWKLEGVSEEDARRAMVPSGTSLLGVVKHLAYVERWWFQQVPAGRRVDFPWSEDDPHAEWRIEEGESIADVVALYDAECAVSPEILARLEDPDGVIRVLERDVSLRRGLVHVLEEVARHTGHMDILRELIEGAVGDFPPVPDGGRRTPPRGRSHDPGHRTPVRLECRPRGEYHGCGSAKDPVVAGGYGADEP